MVEIHKYSVKEIYGRHTFILLRASGRGGEQTNYIFQMDYNVRV